MSEKFRIFLENFINIKQIFRQSKESFTILSVLKNLLYVSKEDFLIFLSENKY